MTIGAAYRPGMGKPKGFDFQVQDIASAAHLRGVVLMRGDTVVGSLEAADLCRPRVADLKEGGAAVLCWTIRSPEAEAEARRIAANVTFEGYAAAIPA